MRMIRKSWHSLILVIHLKFTEKVFVITGVGSGLVSALRAIDPFRSIGPNEEQRLCVVSITSFALVAAIAVWPSLVSPFRLEVF